MGVMGSAHWICFSQLTDTNIIKKDEIFDAYKYLELDYVKYKASVSFVIMFITNSQIFTNISWRTLSISLGVTMLALKILDECVTLKYDPVGTIAFGLSFFVFEPLNALVYTSIDRTNWWSIVPINVVVKLPLLYFFKLVPEEFSIYTFLIAWVLYVFLIFVVNNEFKDLDF